MKTCDKCGGRGMIYTEEEVEQLVEMLMLALKINPPVARPWEDDE
jgi:hypothetical protein